MSNESALECFLGDSSAITSHHTGTMIISLFAEYRISNKEWRRDGLGKRGLGWPPALLCVDYGRRYFDAWRVMIGYPGHFIMYTVS
jgi:hypothetical protein